MGEGQTVRLSIFAVAALAAAAIMMISPQLGSFLLAFCGAAIAFDVAGEWWLRRFVEPDDPGAAQASSSTSQ
jgi:hypothetical protein